MALPAGFLVGHAADPGKNTGCTVVICPDGARGGVSVQGGAPGTRETDLLRPDCTVDVVHGLFLAGGSAFGLDVGSGMMRYLEEQGIGFSTGFGLVPIVTGAVIFDLSYGDSSIRPDAAMGYQACLSASGESILRGQIGVGMGATVGKAMGFGKVSKTGLGMGKISFGEVEITALVAVNAFGEIYSPQGEILAGIKGDNGSYVSTKEAILTGQSQAALGQNTTIGVILTNADLTKSQATKLAMMGQDGLARSITPLHTPYDGDTLFCLASGKVGCSFADTAILAAEAVQMAVLDAASAK